MCKELTSNNFTGAKDLIWDEIDDEMYETIPYWKRALDCPPKKKGAIRSFIEIVVANLIDLMDVLLKIYCALFWVIYPIWVVYVISKYFG